MVSPDLVYAKGNGFVFCGIFAFNDQYRNTVNEKYYVFPVGILPVEEIIFFGYFIHILVWLVIVYQDKVKLAVFFFAEKSFNSVEVFRLKRDRKIWTIPERWKYGDMAKTVRPILGNEIDNLRELLIRNNLGKFLNNTINPKNLNGFNEIRLLLTSSTGELYTEKILEAWLLENLTNNGNNVTSYQEVTKLFGNLNIFGNTIQAFYLDFIDIFGYIKDKNGYEYGFKVIELKKGEPNTYPQTIIQLTKYMDWITTELAGGDALKVEGIIVANNFGDDYIVSFAA